MRLLQGVLMPFSHVVRAGCLLALLVGPVWSDEPKDFLRLFSGAKSAEPVVPDRTDHVKERAADGVEGEPEASPQVPFFHPEAPIDYRLELASGRVIDIGEVFAPRGRQIVSAFRDRKGLGKSPLVRLNYEESAQPMLVAARRGKVLNGPFASFTEDGAPVALAFYDKGERGATLLTWDADHRPLVFAQYQEGKLDGIRCLFRGCCDRCKKGHLWLVEEWTEGVLQAAHLVADDEQVRSIKFRNGQRIGVTSPDDRDFELAKAELAKFEDRLAADEGKLKQFLNRYYTLEQRAVYERMKLQAMQRSYRLMGALRETRFPTRGGVVGGGIMAPG